jgi:arginyl-tRNA synthetase
MVGLGAVKFPMLAIDTNKVSTFDWETALDFHVRANSIITKAGEPPSEASADHELADPEVSLLERLSRFPVVVQRSAEDYKPLHIANYVYDLARDFTEFYQNCPVIKAEQHERAFRLRLTAAARQVIDNALGLLGISAPEVM